MLFGEMMEATQEEIVLNETPAEAFKLLLKFIYTDNPDVLNGVNDDLVAESLRLSHLYNLTEFVIIAAKKLEQLINFNNVFHFYAMSKLYDLHELNVTCLQFIEWNFH